MTDSLQHRWDKLLVTFFGSANFLDWPSTNVVVTSFVNANEQSLTRESIGPFILPCVRADGSTEYFAIAIDDDQSQELRQLVASLSGATYTTYDGRAVAQDDGDPVVAAAGEFAGSLGRVFQFSVVGGDTSKKAVREQMLRLLELCRRRPRRAVVAAKPIGRLLRDFDRALENLDETTARELLFGPITAGGRLSAMNRLFLQSRYLVTFARWQEFEALPSFEDLLRTSRPALVSDALAQLACFQLSEGGNGESLAERFADVIAPRFGDLIPSVGRIRSAMGARYYVLFHLNAGDSTEDLDARLEGTRWGEEPLVREIFGSGSVELAQVSTAIGVAAIAEAMELGRCEHAIELMAAAPPSVDLLPFMFEAVRRTLSMEAMNLVVRYREHLGDSIVDAEIARQESSEPAAAVHDGVAIDWADRIRLVAQGELSTTSFQQLVEEEGLLEFARDPLQIELVALQVEASTNPGGPGRVLIGSIELLRRIGLLLPDSESGRLARLRFAVLYLWSMGDESGDHGIAGDILDEVECLLGAGVTTDEYREVLDLLTARWEPFRTDVAFGLGVRAVEVLAASQPDGVHQLSAFASPIFARITEANIDRIDSIDLAVANGLSRELHLGIRLEPTRVAEQSEPPRANWQGNIGIYSLDEQALRRASEVIGDELPGAEISTSSEKVGGERLAALARRADVMIVAAQHAKHPAFHAIQAARPNRPLTYPVGKGSSSLIRAALDGVAALRP